VIDLIRLSFVLTLIACAAALLIAMTNAKTADRIALQQSAAEQQALRQIMPEGVAITAKQLQLPSENTTLEYWIGGTTDDTVYAFKIENRGYSSTITYLVCTSKDGVISGMAVLEQSETPGLGSRVQETLSKKYIWNGLLGPKEQTSPWFSDQFVGISINKPIAIEKTVGEWHGLSDKERLSLIEKNGITAITGSTISTRAVTNGLTAKAQRYLKAIRG